MRYFFHIAYKGTQYRGWQRQPNVLSVQEVLETHINHILKTDTYIVGCGRTDAEVHASQYFFHLTMEQLWNFDLKARLNRVLPPDIAVFDIIPVKDKAHAQYDATQRTYDYFIHTQKSSFLNEFSAWYPEHFDIAAMQKAVALLPCHSNFRSFCKQPDKHNSTICHVMAARLFAHASGDRLQFQITSNRFLRGMIRIIVSRLLKVGTGRMSLDEFESYLIGTKTPQFTNFAHPQGLHLSKVVYPYLELPLAGSISLSLR